MVCYKHLWQLTIVFMIFGGTFLLNYLTKLLMVKLNVIEGEISYRNPRIQLNTFPKYTEQTLKECDCKRSIKRFGMTSTDKSSCSKEALDRGSHQKVVAFTFFEGPTFDKFKRDYLTGVSANLEKMETFYDSDWTMRLYYDIKKNSESLKELCDLACSKPNLELCNVNENDAFQPEELNKNSDTISKLYPLLWRFLPILDADVDILLVRDLDSHISKREANAVQEFLNSSMDFHVMRDHPLHIRPIMGGLWDVKLAPNRTKYETLLKTLLQDSEHSLGARKERNHDQILLEKHFWPEVRNEALMHDSFTCQKYWNARPFPSKRPRNEANNFVGAVISHGKKVPKACPKQCRPYNHPEWVFC